LAADLGAIAPGVHPMSIEEFEMAHSEFFDDLQVSSPLPLWRHPRAALPR
jgi:hypothetical protein